MALDPRYVVIKSADIGLALDTGLLSLNDNAAIEAFRVQVEQARKQAGKPPFRALVVEQDWPEYDAAAKMISDRVNDYTPLDNPPPLAYIIVDGDGNPHFSEHCISGDYLDLKSEVNALNEELEPGEDSYRVIGIEPYSISSCQQRYAWSVIYDRALKTFPERTRDPVYKTVISALDDLLGEYGENRDTARLMIPILTDIIAKYQDKMDGEDVGTLLNIANILANMHK